MVTKKCSHCGGDVKMFPSRAKKSKVYFCNKSCHRKYKNIKDNPSKHRDLSGENNPMFGISRVAWNKGLKGCDCHNWSGGIHKRKDGYYRININGIRYLYHRYLLGVKDEKVVHHINSNRSDNRLENLKVLANQSEHAKIHASN
jgi:hypothetical protein